MLHTTKQIVETKLNLLHANCIRNLITNIFIEYFNTECMENIHVQLIIARDFIYFTSIYFRVSKFGMNLKRLLLTSQIALSLTRALFFMQTSKHINIDLSIHRYIKRLHKSLRGGSFCLLHNKLKGLQFWFTLCVCFELVLFDSLDVFVNICCVSGYYFYVYDVNRLFFV